MDKKSILAEARFYFAQCVFNTSCQYAAANRFKKKQEFYQRIGLTITIVTVICLALTIVFWETQCSIGLRILSFVGTFLTTASLVFELVTKEDIAYIKFCHLRSAEDYKAIRDQFMDLIRCLKDEQLDCEPEKRLQLLLHDYAFLGKYSLSTNSEDYNEAQSSLGLVGNGESFTWSNQEINRFLPEELQD